MHSSRQRFHLADEAPSAGRLTDYDEAHFVVYLRLLDAKAKGTSEDDMMQVIFDAAPDKTPAQARQALRSHLERARWMTEEGYKELFKG